MSIESRSKRFSFLLRHDTDFVWDETGWRKVTNLVANYGYTRNELATIVAEDSKGRYEFNEDRALIRATQGHSIPGINPDLKRLYSSCGISVLYHGTSSRFIEAIDREGLRSMGRNYVQLSGDIETAKTVGRRHGGELVIYEVDLAGMLRDKIEVFVSHNGVYMTKYIETKYLTKSI